MTRLRGLTRKWGERTIEQGRIDERGWPWRTGRKSKRAAWGVLSQLGRWKRGPATRRAQSGRAKMSAKTT